jgi:Tol biopolymer transport system component
MYDETTGRSEIWLANADGSNKRSLTEGLSPSFSPDGTTILYSSENEQPGSLWMMIDTDGSNERKLGMLDRPKFAPDGKHIVCFSPEWQRQIWKMELDGSNRERLQAPTAYATDLRPCRDGFIFLLVGSDRVGDIYVVDTNAWTAKRVTSTR